ncbi:MAG: flavocytochrome c [Eggerthellaceae bacterium]|jgi:fumarate reductase flavoprotein subunit/urocanate reductase|nr:flavocytochrome c [Eggerthellaceae bacterium]
MSHLSRRQFIAAGGAAALGGALALTGCSPKSSGSSKSSSGSSGENAAIGTGMGKHGNFDVAVLMKDGSIDRIEVIGSRETPGMGDVAMNKLSNLIIDHQTLNVDTVSGATLSSMAFVGAVGDALDAMGESSSKWQNRDKATPTRDTPIPSSAKVVVVGAGGAGFAAAITAAKAGADVVLIDKMGILGGDTCLSGGELAAPGNWIQQQAGISDSPDKLASDMLEGGDNLGDPELVSVIANGALDASQWLTYEGGVSWKHDLMQFGGHNTKRSIIPITHSGSEMTTKLTTRVKSIDAITLLDNVKASELVKTGDRITGIKVEDTLTGDTTTINCKAVILATGGFGSNIDMRVRYNPDMDSSILSTDSVAATGDGLTMAQAIGANLIDMQYIQTYPTCDPKTGSLLYVGDMRLEDRAIMINKEGKRFVEELGRRDVLSDAIKKQTDGIGYMLFTQSEADATGLLETHADEYENLESRGIIIKSNTLEGACDHFGIDATELHKTVDTWNQFCKNGSDTDFNYRGDLNPIDDGPYYIMSYKPAVHYTMGGLHINTAAEVLDNNGAAIGGLYAAGEVAGHKMGDNRLGSCSMADIYTFGRIAGTNAAAYGAK